MCPTAAAKLFCPLTSPSSVVRPKYSGRRDKTSMNRFAAPPDLEAGLSDSAPSRAGRAIRPAHAAERRLDARRAVLLPARGPAASEPFRRLAAAGASDFILALRSWCARWRRTATTTSRSWARPSSRRSTPSGWPTCRCGSAAAARTAGATSGWIACL